MTGLPVMNRGLRSLRSTTIWYTVGMAAYAAITLWLYPTVEATLRAVELPPELLRFFGTEDIGSPTGYLTARYQAFAPVVLMVWAIVASTGLVAGEETRGSLEAVIAHPISRTRLMCEAMIAFAICTLVILGGIVVAWAITVPFVDLRGDITLSELAVATISTAPLALFFGALGCLVGAVAPTRGAAAGILTAFAISSYLVASFAQVAPTIEWMRYASPYYYADSGSVLRAGINWEHQAALAAGTIVAALLAILAFQGREIGVAAWQPLAFIRRGSRP